MNIDPSPMSPDELRAALDVLGWTQAELATHIGVVASSVSQWLGNLHRCKGPAAALIRMLVQEQACTSKSECAQ
jgi:DNA-binding transcriptional regulator YiaG